MEFLPQIAQIYADLKPPKVVYWRKLIKKDFILICDVCVICGKYLFMNSLNRLSSYLYTLYFILCTLYFVLIVLCSMFIVYCQLPTADCQLPTAYCRLPTADCRLFYVKLFHCWCEINNFLQNCSLFVCTLII